MVLHSCLYTSDTQADKHYLLLNNCLSPDIPQFLIARNYNSFLWFCNYVIIFKNLTEDEVAMEAF